MILDFSDLLRQVRLEAMLPVLAGGAIDCYTLPRPAAGGASGSAVLIGTVPLATPAGAVAVPALSLVVPVEGQAVAAGDIAWCRLHTSDGAWLLDGDAGPGGSEAALRFDRLNMYPGAFIRLIGGTFVEP